VRRRASLDDLPQFFQPLIAEKIKFLLVFLDTKVTRT
jgi:hypothetical protein